VTIEELDRLVPRHCIQLFEFPAIPCRFKMEEDFPWEFGNLVGLHNRIQGREYCLATVTTSTGWFNISSALVELLTNREAITSATVDC
jgi:hypothetical protein